MAELTRVGRRLLHCLREDVGANATHVPLFRKFPDSVPADTADFYVRRVFSLLLQDPARPCVLCGETGTVRPVSPCAHLVCRTCWDGADFSACPLCHRRIASAAVTWTTPSCARRREASPCTETP
ncbi:RING finger family 4 domain-containing protein [Nonomuraea diastatica]|uniref:RING finger family 4 domain-containing protein n=1 Tax=Nonomuraea diastatica TaxID=1848329 RepID=UPI00140AE86D|nr:RING finger family 4 domain-containing protein [Nonomuraea diastatica]